MKPKEVIEALWSSVHRDTCVLVHDLMLIRGMDPQRYRSPNFDLEIRDESVEGSERRWTSFKLGGLLVCRLRTAGPPPEGSPSNFPPLEFPGNNQFGYYRVWVEYFMPGPWTRVVSQIADCKKVLEMPEDLIDHETLSKDDRFILESLGAGFLCR